MLFIFFPGKKYVEGTAEQYFKEDAPKLKEKDVVTVAVDFDELNVRWKKHQTVLLAPWRRIMKEHTTSAHINAPPFIFNWIFCFKFNTFIINRIMPLKITWYLKMVWPNFSLVSTLTASLSETPSLSPRQCWINHSFPVWVSETCHSP